MDNSKHEIKLFKLYDNDRLCTVIRADFTDKTVSFDNYTDFALKTAFGKKKTATWEDFYNFLEGRCIPKTRDGLQFWLNANGLDVYDPLEIVKKTKGRMAEDHQWIEIGEE